MAPAELYAAIRGGLTPSDIDVAVLSLGEAGIVTTDARGCLCPCAALTRLDKLGLIDV